MSNGLGYCEAVEKLMNVEAPPRAKYIRVILTELHRIASHQLWLGTHALDIGAMTPLFYTFRDREEILKIFEKYCGARLTTHAFRIGGCQYETYAGFEKDVKNFLTFFAPKIDEYETLLTTNRIWLERTKNVGVISAADAIALGRDRAGAARQRREVGSAQGPALRGLLRIRFRNSGRHQRRHLRPVPGPHDRNAPVDAHHRAGGQPAFPKARSWAKCPR